MNIYWQQFLALLAAHLLAVASPGPDFALIMKQSITHGRKTASFSAVGIGLGLLVHLTYTVLGLSFIIYRSPRAFLVMRLIGGIYLIFMGMKSWLKKKETGPTPSDIPEETGEEQSWRSALLAGFLTNVLNPKVTIFFMAIYTAIVHVSTPAYIKMFYGLIMSVIAILWFLILSSLFSSAVVRNLFLRAGIWFDRLMACLFILLGAKLIFF